MPHCLRRLTGILIPALLFVAGPAAGLASATTVDDLVKLKASKPPVSDEVLIALIESDGSVFHLTADDIVSIRQKGLSNDVIIAMLLTATRERQREEARFADQQAQPQIVPVEQPIYTTPGVTPVEPPTAGPGTITPPVATPVVGLTPYGITTVGVPRRSHVEPVYVPVAVPVAVPVVRPQPKPEPVYWGFGGKRRPDTWAEPNQPAPQPQTPPATPTTTDTRKPQNGRGGGGGAR